jgi:uncharacterized protein
MTISEIMKQMIFLSDGNTHDISHFLKVHAYARLIGESEGLDASTLYTLEAAALLHDIACPLCREKYGNTNGKKQELEGMPLARAFFHGTDVPDGDAERVVYLVGHHHTVKPVDGIDYQILLEADYLVNADESRYSAENIRSAEQQLFRTKTGTALLRSIYPRQCGSKD